jgi:hypothetical protein
VLHTPTILPLFYAIIQDMRPKRQRNLLIPYLILNVILSAVVTLLVLSYWDARQRTNQPVDNILTRFGVCLVSGVPRPTSSPAVVALPTPTIPTSPVLDVESVVGLGVYDSEYVLIKRIGDGEVWMDGWKVKDQDGHVYPFPDTLMLNKDASIRLYTRPGLDTVLELHWGLTQSVWRSGEKVLIEDPLGNTRVEYTIP